MLLMLLMLLVIADDAIDSSDAGGYKLLVCGQALSHCVNYTMRDIMYHWDDAMSDLVLLKDGAIRCLPFYRYTV